MPRINRIRVTNIQYDYGKKQFPDLLLDLSERDALVLLTNGGGKTLLLQLIMQVVLPNERLQGRRILELLESSRYTGHVAVEWLLDSTGAQKDYVCTGFCFSGSSEDQFRYFNYIFGYSEAKEEEEPMLDLFGNPLEGSKDSAAEGLTIATLPFVSELEHGRRQPIRYQELRDWFRDQASHQVQIFDQVQSYQERLRYYQILPEEWKNIRDTNNSEGGVDKFFERCRTTTQLMDNLLIPSVEQVIFRNEGNKQELVKAFTEYKLSLLQIPIIKQNIADFAIVQSQAEEVVDVVRTLDQRQRELERLEHELIALAKTFQNHVEEATLKGEGLAEQLQAFQAELTELNWQIASHRVFLKQLEYATALQKEKQVQGAYEEVNARLAEAVEGSNQLFALNHYNQLLKSQGDLAEYGARLAALDLAEPELQAELTKAKGQLLTAWHLENNTLAKQLQRVNEALSNIEKNLKQIQRTKEDSQAELADLHQEQGSIVAWLDSYAKRQRELGDLIPDFSREQPKKTHKLYSNKRSQIETNLSQLEELAQKAEQELTACEAESVELRLGERDLQASLKTVRGDLASYEQASERVGALLAEHAIFQLPVLEKKEAVLPRVRELGERSQHELVLAQATLANKEEKWALLQSRDSYLPHPVMLSVKRQLESLGLPVLLGSEWLASQPLTQGEKEEYLANHPLLPFCVIVEKGQLTSVRQGARALQNLPADFPLLFMVRQSLRPTAQEEGRGLRNILADELYTLHSQEFQLYTSEEYFKRFKETMANQMGDEKARLGMLRERAETVNYLKGQVEQFYRDYSLEKVAQWRKQEDELRLAIEANQEEALGLKQRQASLTARLKQAKTEQSQLTQEQRHVEKYLDLLTSFLPFHQDYAEQRRKSDILGEELSLLKGQLARWDEAVVKLHGEKAQSGYELKAREEALASHTREFSNYGLETTLASDTDESYEELKGQVDGILQKLSGRQSVRKDLEDLWHRAKNEVEEAKQAIKKCNVSVEWLSQEQRLVTESELTRAEGQVATLQNQAEESKETLWTAQGVTRSCHEVLVALSEGIVGSFQKEPFLLYDETSHQGEFAAFKHRLEQVKAIIDQLQEEEQALHVWKLENQEASEQILERYQALVARLWNKVLALSETKWEERGQRPRVALRQVETARNEANRQVETNRLKVSQAFHRYGEELTKTNNPRVRQFVREIQSIVSEGRLYDFDFVETQFIRIFEAIAAYQQQYQKRLEESERNFTHLVNLSIRRAMTVYESILEIPKNSRIGLYGRSLQLLQMEWPTKSEEENRLRMEQYLHGVIEQMQAWQQEGLDDDTLDSRLGELLRTRSLLNVLAPVENCRLQVYKPRSESLIRNQRLHHAPWDDVARWSGGENYSAYITMFMVMLAHIRQQMEGKANSWKVLVADNPFGKASAGHVLDPIFEVARANQIQLLCFTAHKEEAILRYFPVVYSLQLRSTYGKEVMQAEQLESGFYQRGEAQDVLI